MLQNTERSGQQPGRSLCTFAILIFILLSIDAYAQQSKVDSQGPPGQTKGYTIGVNVDLVLMYASVFDKNGHFVGGLQYENFKLYEDDIEQKIESFSQDDVPVSIGILMDLSGSMRAKREQVDRAAEAFIRASNPQDEVFLIGFNDEVELLQDFTGDIDEITDSLENTVVAGGTSLYDAIYLGVQKAQNGTLPKKAIVVISDGEDRDSYYKFSEVLGKVQESEVQIFFVGFMDPIPDKGFFGKWSKSAEEREWDNMERITQDTGGKAFFPDKLDDIHEIVAEIAAELRSQYSIGYFSSNPNRDGTFRRVKIRLLGDNASKNRIRYRRGYFAPKEAVASSQSAVDSPQ